MPRLSFIFVGIILITYLTWFGFVKYNDQKSLSANLNFQNTILQKTLADKSLELDNFQKIDQVLINKKNTQELINLKKILSEVIQSYSDIIEIRGDKRQFVMLDKLFAQSLDQLIQEKYSSSSASLISLNAEIKKISEVKTVSNIPIDGASGTQKVSLDSGDFVVRIINADLKSNKVVVETVSDKDCVDNCPVAPLSELAIKAGAFAAINGPYFCPASYPACASKKNSFDILMMNRQKTYFNSDNNIYSSVPATIFSTTSRFVTESSQWGRDTSVDAVIAGQPLLVFNGQSQFNGDGDPKKSSKGTRAFLGGTDSIVYIGLVYNCTVAEMAQVVAKLGIKNAINLDSGGSIAMIQNGKYVAGPGRDLPFGIMLVKR